jgi:vancomycin resistance protein YoaR
MILGSASTLVAAAAVGIPASCNGQVYPGVRAGGVDISGLSPATAEALLRSEFARFEGHAVTFTLEDLRWEASLAELGVSIDYPAMIQRAMRHGRDGTIIDRYTSLVVDGSDVDIPLEITRDDEALREFVAELDADIAVDPIDAKLTLSDGEIVVEAAEEGRRLDVDRAVAVTKRKIDAGKTATVALETVPIAPAVTADDLEQARASAARLVSGPVAFTHEGLTYPVEFDTLLAALKLDEQGAASLDTDALVERIDQIGAAVARPPQNVMLGWDNGLYVVQDDVDGVRLDRDTAARAIQELAGGDERTAALPVEPVKAAARADNIDELGIDGHLVYGSSSFVGSSEERARNVAVAARNISYKLVPPGEMFSFNDLLGPISVENGFVEGKIIQGDWAASDLGGGACQVSTTVFRAAALAGFQFVEWHPHSWRLAFYEADGSPPGFDGAIYQPNSPDEGEQDLVFQNPLDSWLLLMMVIDKGTVAAHFYGKGNGWTTELGEPQIGEPKPIPDPVERVNPNLAPGERVQVQQAQAGMKVTLHRTVTAADGTVVSDGDFVSDYVSVPEAWEVGPS